MAAPVPAPNCPDADPCAAARGYALLEVWRGWPLVVNYSAGTDLTGQGLAVTIRDPVAGAALLQLSSGTGGVTITDAPGGLATWTWTGAQTAALPGGQLPFEVALTGADGVTPAGPSPLTWGRVLARPTAPVVPTSAA